MSSNPHRGRVYRYCACRDQDRKLLGPRCSKLATSKHGRWAFAVDMPTTGRRKTLRRCGFPTHTDAQKALARVLACEQAGIYLDDRETVTTYLTTWLRDKARNLKPTTIARYTDYITKDLIPALGAIRLERLTHRHIAEFITAQLAQGRKPVTLRRCIATLSSALGDAVRRRRLPHNAARYAPLPHPPKRERCCWTPQQACAFLRYCATINDPLTDLFEVIIGTGMRKGEALGLHWADVHLDEHLLFVRYTLSNINNTTPVLTAPKTKSSYGWIGLSDRVTDTLRRQADRQRRQRLAQPAVEDYGLVFTRPNGRPLRPEYVLRRLHRLSAEAGLPRIRVHDLRHLAATLMLSSQVPMAMASKTLRHATLSTTVNIYGHLQPNVAHDAVEAIATSLRNAALLEVTAA